jgi:periplasmic copper chaperone A
MTRRFLGLCLIATCALLPLAAPAQAHDYTAGAIKIAHPWVRVPPPAAKVAGGFMTLTNTGSVPDRLVGGTAAGVGRFEVHEMTVIDGVMRMRQLQPGLDIAPGASVELKPGSYHVMFMDLKAPILAGQTIKGTLVFEKAGTVEIEYKVEPAGTKSSDHGGSGSGSGAAAKSGKGSGSGSGSGAGNHAH